jgi:hypothetical protein
VLRVSPAQRRVIRKNRPKIENPILVLYSTYFHPRPPFCAPLSPRSPGPSGMPPPTRSGPEPLWIHPRPTRPSRGLRHRQRGPSGETTAPLGLLPELLTKISKINYTFREFGSDRIQYSKLLEMMTSSNFKYLTIHVMTIRKLRTVILTFPSSLLY